MCAEQLHPTLRKKREGWGTRQLVTGTEPQNDFVDRAEVLDRDLAP